MSTVWEEIELKIRASYPYLYLITHEESRVLANLARVGQHLSLPVVSHSRYRGFEPPIEAEGNSVMEKIAASDSGGIFVLKDFHLELENGLIQRQIKDLRETLMRGKKTIIVTAPVRDLPIELEKYFAFRDIPLPAPLELKALFTQMCKQQKVDITTEQAELFARSASGLTAEEAMLIFSRLLLEPERVELGDTVPIVEEKRRLVESDGVLQFNDRGVNLEDVGGLRVLKQWLAERDAAFELRAREFGLPEPKGLLLLGVQGCGKSLTAKAVAAHWKLPLVQMDLGAAFSSVRSPEETIRRSLKLLEAMSPVVVWIDEIEKGFAGTKEGGGEVSPHRVFGHFITWMQEKQRPVFVVATANSVDQLPPELLRKGRFDELFFVDLPDSHERREILEVHLKKRGMDPGKFELNGLTEDTRNYTGAELEQIVVDGLYIAFGEKRALSLVDMQKATSTMVPIYNTYEDDIKYLREWAKDRARKASTDASLADYFEREEKA